MMPENPWEAISSSMPKFVLEEDQPYIDYFNSVAKDEHKIITDRVPEPRLGSVNAPVFILQSNPGIDELPEYENERVIYQTRQIRHLHDQTAPHIHIESGNQWWKRRLKVLTEILDRDTVAANVCSVEFFPYRSKRWGQSQLRVPSQAYTFAIVRRAIKNGAVFVLTRSKDAWFGAIPELSLLEGTRLFTVNSFRAAYISQKNLPDGAFDVIHRAIDS